MLDEMDVDVAVLLLVVAAIVLGAFSERGEGE